MRYQSLIENRPAGLLHDQNESCRRHESAELQTFNTLMESKEQDILKQSLQVIDKKNFLLGVLEKKNLLKLSSEILKVNPFAQGLYSMEKKEQAIQFLICLDFLIKGVLIHWSIKLKNEDNGRGNDLMKGLDTKFPLLIGDQYHSMAYFMITRVGN